MSHDILTRFSGIIKPTIQSSVYSGIYTCAPTENKLNDNCQKLHLFIVTSDAQFLVRNKDRVARTSDCKNFVGLARAHVVFDKRDM